MRGKSAGRRNAEAFTLTRDLRSERKTVDPNDPEAVQAAHDLWAWWHTKRKRGDDE